MPRKNLYKGYSTFEYERTKSLTLRDVDLVKLDLLNHMYTLRGARVMMPNFGTMIPSLVFEPLDSEMLDELYAEVKSVFDYDPRVAILELYLVPSYDTNSVVVNCTLLYVELEIVDDFELNIQFED